MIAVKMWLAAVLTGLEIGATIAETPRTWWLRLCSLMIVLWGLQLTKYWHSKRYPKSAPRETMEERPDKWAPQPAEYAHHARYAAEPTKGGPGE